MVRVDTQTAARGVVINRMYVIGDYGVNEQIVDVLRRHPSGLTRHQLTQAVMPGHNGDTVSSVAKRMAQRGQITRRPGNVNGRKEWMYYANSNKPSRKKRAKKVKERRL